MKIRIQKMPDNYDSDRITFIDSGEEKGFGLIARDDKRIGLERCPKCGRENYAMVVMSGVCCWCNFNANKCKFE